jgi:hypothetical protein
LRATHPSEAINETVSEYYIALCTRQKISIWNNWYNMHSWKI